MTEKKKNRRQLMKIAEKKKRKTGKSLNQLIRRQRARQNG